MRGGLIVVALAWLLACGAEGGRGPDAGPDGFDVASEAAPADVASEAEPDGKTVFTVSVTEWTGSKGNPDSAFAGAGRGWQDEEPSSVAATAGDCALVLPVDPPFCDPPCELGSVCVADDTCGAPNPPLGAGDIVLTGLKVACTLHPETQYHYYSALFDPEPADGDLFVEGARLVATAPGDSVPPFTVETRGVARLEHGLACPPALPEGAGLDVTWTPGAQAGARISFVLQSGNHGAQFARIVCDTADTGSLHVDAALVDAWLAEWLPFYSWRLARWHEEWIDVPDVRVTFSAASTAGCMW